MKNKSIICRLEICERPREPGSTLCSLHRSRWKKYKSFDLPKKTNLPENIIKNCKNHGYLTVDQVYKDGIKFYRCKICRNNTNKTHLNKNPELTAFRRKIYDQSRPRYDNNESINGFKQRLRRMFNLTIEDYERMLIEQNHVCKICKQPEKAHNRLKLSVDHCHITHKIRGLLCGRCNTMIGMAKDNIDILFSAIDYLGFSRHQ